MAGIKTARSSITHARPRASNKYITWFADSRDSVRTLGASYMQAPGLKYCIWYWTIALKPLDGGKR